MHDVAPVKEIEPRRNAENLNNLEGKKPLESAGTNNLRSVCIWIRLQICGDITTFVERRYEHIPLHNKADEWDEIWVIKPTPDGSLTLESLGQMNVSKAIT
jgi:5-methylcytosine-specific restriction endonuclease McrA